MIVQLVQIFYKSDLSVLIDMFSRLYGLMRFNVFLPTENSNRTDKITKKRDITLKQEK